MTCAEFSRDAVSWTYFTYTQNKPKNHSRLEAVNHLTLCQALARFSQNLPAETDVKRRTTKLTVFIFYTTAPTDSNTFIFTSHYSWLTNCFTARRKIGLNSHAGNEKKVVFATIISSVYAYQPLHQYHYSFSFMLLLFPI